MKEELKEVENPNTTYTVYKTSTGLYLSNDVCDLYNVGDRDDFQTIKGDVCYKISYEDIEYINRQNRYEGKVFEPHYETIFAMHLALSFVVFSDSNENKLYISKNLCEKYAIKPISKRIIEGSTYCNVTEEDLDKIEQASEKEKILLKRNYVDIDLDDEIQPAESLFLYYFDIETGKNYIQRDILDLAHKYNIKVEGTPKIIENRNCYSITEDELKEIENNTDYRGIEKIIKPKVMPKLENPFPAINEEEQASIKIPPMITIYKDIQSGRLFVNKNIYDRFQIAEGEIKVIINNAMCYEITPVDAKFIEQNDNNNYSPYRITYLELPLGLDKPKNNEIQKITIYKDIHSNRLFVGKVAAERFNITSKNSNIIIDYEHQHEIKKDDAAFIEDNANNNYSPYVVSYRELPLGLDKPKNNEITIHKDIHSNRLFVDKNAAERFNITSENPNIIIDNEKQHEIKNDDLTFIEGNANNNYSPYVVNYNELPLGLEKEKNNVVTIYKDKQSSREFVGKDTANRFNITKETDHVTIDDIEHLELDTEDSKFINNNANNTYSPYEVNYKEIPLGLNKPEKTIVAYRNANTGMIYIPEEYATNKNTKTKIISGKTCYETTLNELEHIYDTNIVITDIYPYECETLDIIICNTNGKLFVSKNNLDKLNFYIENPHKIMVNKEVYEEITPDDLDLIRSKETDDLHINIILKHITPTKKNN